MCLQIAIEEESWWGGGGGGGRRWAFFDFFLLVFFFDFFDAFLATVAVNKDGAMIKYWKKETVRPCSCTQQQQHRCYQLVLPSTTRDGSTATTTCQWTWKWVAMTIAIRYSTNWILWPWWLVDDKKLIFVTMSFEVFPVGSGRNSTEINDIVTKKIFSSPGLPTSFLWWRTLGIEKQFNH